MLEKEFSNIDHQKSNGLFNNNNTKSRAKAKYIIENFEKCMEEYKEDELSKKS